MTTQTKRIIVSRVEVPDPPPVKDLTITSRDNQGNEIRFYPANEYVGVRWNAMDNDAWADLHGEDLDLLINSLVELRKQLKKG